MGTLNEMDELNNRAWGSTFKADGSADALAKEALSLAERTANLNGKAVALRTIGFHHLYFTNYKGAFECLRESERIFESQNDVDNLMATQSAQGIIFSTIGEYDQAMSYHLKAMETSKSAKSPTGRLFMYSGFGTFYVDMKQIELARDMYAQGLYLITTTENQPELLHKVLDNSDFHATIYARVINGMGVTEQLLGNFPEALEWHKQGLKIYELNNNSTGIARSMNDLGKLYQSWGKPDKAEIAFQQSLQLRKEANAQEGVLTTLLNLAELYLAQQANEKAFEFLNAAMEKADQIQNKPKISRCHELFFQYFKQIGRFEEALQHQETHFELKNELDKQQTQQKIQNLKMTFELEKTEREAEIQRKQNEILSNLNTQLTVAIDTIHDSISYARRIQEALLPQNHEIQKLLPDSFVLYMPRDEVSGDFYWVGKQNQGSLITLAVVDCTGHGIPGAFMSVLGIALFNQIYKEADMHHPGRLLSRLDYELRQNLRKTSEDEQVLDGMEAAVVTIDLTTRKMEYAGANIPLYRVNSGELTEFKPDKIALGGNIKSPDMREYSSHIIDYKSEDAFFLFSDGFRDQFGFQNGARQKYSTKRFQTVIGATADLPKWQQKECLEREFSEWKGMLKQLDDVLVMGFRIH